MTDAADFARLNDEWEHYRDRAIAPDASRRDMESAVRWVLINVFGTADQFLNDAPFHAKVCAAEQMLAFLRKPAQLPEGLTAQKLREIADWFDTYDEMGESYIDLVRTLVGPVSAEREATRQAALATMQGTEIQDELRAWAAHIEGVPNG